MASGQSQYDAVEEYRNRVAKELVARLTAKKSQYRSDTEVCLGLTIAISIVAEVLGDT